jgi:hypothetical protein
MFSIKTSPSKITPSFTILAFLIKTLFIILDYLLIFLIEVKSPKTASTIIELLIFDSLVRSVK